VKSSRLGGILLDVFQGAVEPRERALAAH
jgi:hypothetical protein